MAKEISGMRMCVCSYCGKKTWDLLSNKFLCILCSTMNFRHNVEWQVSRTYSSCLSEILNLNSNSPFSLLFPLKIIILFSVSMSLSILITSYIWDRATLFAVAKIWKQPKCPSTDKWIKKIWYMYTVEYYSALKM